MILPVIGTIGTRVLIAVANLLLVAVSARTLGMDGVGTIALIILGITFILLFNNIVGGGGLVYLAARYATSTLRWPSYGWAIITATVAWVIMRWLPMVPTEYVLPTVLLAWLRSITGIHSNLLLGRERYGAHNSLLLVQSILLLAAFTILVQYDGATVMDYIHAGFVADGVIALIGGLLLTDGGSRITAVGHPLVELFRLGALSQLANGLQLLNYRFVYLLIDRMQGSALLGLYSVTTQLAESAWLVPKSLGTVLYARVSNTADLERQRDLSLTVLKIATLIALCTVIILLLLPDTVYQLVFGPEVVGIAPLIAWMSPGLVAMSASQALSHYLSGSGRVHHNTIGSGIGLVITLIVGYQVIPSMGLTGAAITTSLAYCSAVLYQIFIFNRITRAHMRHYLPNADDVERLRTLWIRMVGR
ncbi:MAG: polysaccharide biosynthesis C-terminal domain-containing protein [Flavobacteriales bacterium]|nr:polysaccharide biosynthesis C-terminal domain-containing protein [Flavobacteriales bacterium]